MGEGGTYYQEALARTNLVFVDLVLAKVVPDSVSANRALRALCDGVGKTVKLSRHSITGSPTVNNSREQASSTWEQFRSQDGSKAKLEP